MESKDYVITCLNCGGHSRLGILNDRDILYKDHTPIISGRLRPDMVWGWECICGQDSRVAPEEKDQLDVLVQGGAHSIKKIADSLKIRHSLKFKMELA